jgi:hypothetical protein
MLTTGWPHPEFHCVQRHAYKLRHQKYERAFMQFTKEMPTGTPEADGEPHVQASRRKRTRCEMSLKNIKTTS